MKIHSLNRQLASKEEYFQLFLVCAFPVHLWAILTLMKWASTLILPLDGAQILGVVAYVLVFALLESLFVFGLLFALSLILPQRHFHSQLIPVGSVIIFLASTSAAFIHLYQVWKFEVIPPNLWAGFWVFLGLAAVFPLVHLVKRNQRLETAIRSAVEKLTVLSMIYLVFDFLGVFVLLVRNLY
jgi:hypothetical protein